MHCKNKVIASDEIALVKIKKDMGELIKAENAKTQTVKLGVDYAAGQPSKYTKATERLKRATVKTKSLLGYCKKGWRTTNIVKAHVMGATMYGARVVGVRPEQLAKIRSLIRSTTSSSNSGGSATAVLALQKCRALDPAYKATSLPVIE